MAERRNEAFSGAGLSQDAKRIDKAMHTAAPMRLFLIHFQNARMLVAIGLRA